ncbi:hypothetical protein BH24GEM2_BH24GEM2_00070 [soil metagenome]
MGVWLMHNIQYGNPREAGDIEAAFGDPAGYVKPTVDPWMDALRGHPSVLGVQLGNEVAPHVPDGRTSPRYLAGFRSYLAESHGTIGNLNERWGTRYRGFGEISLPGARDPGHADLQRYARREFGRFYGSIFDQLFKPVLGRSLGYTVKTAADPFLFRAAPSFTVLGWDDMVANHPLWQLRVLADTDPRPTFNSEIHLYHDRFQYFSSEQRTRYRYLTDALMGQTMSSSFAWGSWSQPAVAAVHRLTPATLAELERMGGVLRRFHVEAARSRTAVLVTERHVEQGLAKVTENPALEGAYAALAATGRPWRFLMDGDLLAHARQLDHLVVWSVDRIPLRTLQAMQVLPRSVRVHWMGPLPQWTEYGRPLPATTLNALRAQVVHHTSPFALTEALADAGLLQRFRARTRATYGWFSAERGSFTFGVEYPRLEVRRATDADGSLLVALVNHGGDAVTIPALTSLPWYDAGRVRSVSDLTQRAELGAGSLVLVPLDVRVLRYRYR